MKNSVEPLGQYNQITTLAPDGFECILVTQNLEVEILSDKANKPSPDSVFNTYHFQNSYISYLRYRAPDILSTQGKVPDMSPSLPVKGTFSINIGSNKILDGRELITLTSSTHSQRAAVNQKSGRYVISLTEHAVVEILESMLGQTLSSPLQFTPNVELKTCVCRGIKSLIDILVYYLCCNEHFFDHPKVGIQFEQLLISMLLANQPNNYSGALSSPVTPPTSRDVKRVLEYIHTHLNEPISLTKLIEISGVPGSSLFAHFKKFTGKSPLTYVSEQRLAKARHDLLNADQSDTVTTIATRWGFTQLGRFSGSYRKTYGELPKETLQRVKSVLKPMQCKLKSR